LNKNGLIRSRGVTPTQGVYCAVGDVNGDDTLEVAVVGQAGTLELHGAGLDTLYWRKTLGAPVRTAPVLGDLNGDGTREIVQRIR
jgi:hypothetical protein